MDRTDQKRLVLNGLLDACRDVLPRPARRFLEGLLADEALLERMRFCRNEERPALRNSVLISVADGGCWAVMLGNDPEGGLAAAQARPRLVLEGLDLAPEQVLEALRTLPVWFLALDPEYAAPPPGEAAREEYTLLKLAGIRAATLRRIALLDQIDAALDAGDRSTYERLSALLAQQPAQ